MQKHKKLRARILPLALAAAMVITALPGTILAEETSSKTDVVTEGNQPVIDESTEENNKAAARAVEKTQLTITLPKLPDRQQMDPVPKMVTFVDFTYEGLKEGDDGPKLLRSKNVRIVGFPTDSHGVIAGRYSLSPEANNLPGYVVTVKGGDYCVTDKKFDAQPFTVSPKAVYTDKKGVQWFNSPITLTATNKVFPYMKVAGVGAWGPTATLTKEVSSSSNGEQFAFSIDDVGTNCIVIYNRDSFNRFNYCLDTLPPEMSSDGLDAYDITDTEVTARAHPKDANGVGSGVKTVYFLCLPEDAPAPTAKEVLSGGNAGTKDSSGFVDYRFSGLRGNTRYRFYAVAEDNVGHQTGIVAATSSFSTNRSPLRGTVVLDNLSPKYGDKITATPNFDTENPGNIYYYWYRAYSDGREDVKIPWAFSSSYTMGIDDVGNKIYSAVRVDNATDYIYSEKSNTVSKADQAPLRFASYSTEVPYGTNDRRISASGGTSSESVNYVSSNPNVATVNSATGSITPVSVGEFTVTATKVGGDYYNDVSKSSKLIKVTPKTLDVTGMTAMNREYDGTNVVTLTGGSLSSIISGDDVELAPFAQGTVSSKSVGTDKAVTVTQISLQGKKADCYDVNLPAGINVDILPKTVTIENVVVKDKPYDGTTTASLETLGIIKGAIAGEDVDVQGGTCAFNDKNAGSNKAVTASGFAIAGRASSNYTLASQPSVVNATIEQAELTASVEKVTIKKGQEMPSDLAVTVAGFATGEDESLSGFVKPIASLDGAVDTTDEKIKAFAVTFAGGNATSNYSFSYKSNAPINIQTVSVNDEDYVADKDLSKWTNETIVVTPTNGYTEISVDKTNWLSSLTIADEGENNLTFYLKKTDGTLTESKTIQSKIDRTAPRGEISIGKNKWNTFLNSITFGLFFKETQTAEITIEDTASGAGKTYFYLSENALTTGEVEALNSWTEGGSAGVAPDWKGIVYAKLTDKAGNASYISSDGLVLDATAPLIAGATDEGVYCISKELSITDDYLDTVSIDGNTATIEDGKITLYDKASAQTVTATDKAKNTVSINVTVNAAHTPAADDGDCTTAITCSVCGEITTPAKTHDWDTVWTSDSSNHWHKCINAGCQKINSKNAHTFGEWIVDKAATETEIGEKHRECSVCVYTEAVETPILPHTHKPVAEWSKDANSHWHNCTANDGERLNKAAHTWNAGEITTPATMTQEGVKTYTCTVCSQTKTESIPKLPSNNVIVDNNNNSNSPQTGDSSNLLLLFTLFLLSGGTLGVLRIRSKRTGKHDSK